MNAKKSYQNSTELEYYLYFRLANHHHVDILLMINNLVIRQNNYHVSEYRCVCVWV